MQSLGLQRAEPTAEQQDDDKSCEQVTICEWRESKVSRWGGMRWFLLSSWGLGTGLWRGGTATSGFNYLPTVSPSPAVQETRFFLMFLERSEKTPGDAGFSSCSSWAQQLWPLGSRAQAHQLGCTGSAVLRHVGSSRTRA